MPMPPALPVAVSPSAGAGAPATIFEFKGAHLGMTLKDWRSMPFPASGPGSSPAKPICSNDAAAKAVGLAVNPAEGGANTVVCTYASRYGRYFLPAALAIDNRYLARNVRYAFRNDRLFRIQYQTSVDAFDAMVSQFDARYGPPLKLVRDMPKIAYGRYFRVMQTWRAPGLDVELIDPVPTTNALSVSFTQAPSESASLRTNSASRSKTGVSHPPA